ncbi:MAG: ATP-binding cassette domain-containing protein [Desulfovibrionaceae bacterium]
MTHAKKPSPDAAHAVSPDAAHAASSDAAHAAIVSLRGIVFAYPGTPADAPPVLRGADFSLASGQRIGLVGPNGSGKTTLFHIIMGLIKPAAGEVAFNGAPVRSERDFTALRRSVGFVFQHADDQLFSPTVLEDVAFGPLNLGLSPHEAAQAARDALDRLGLRGFEDCITHKLSGGEKKLVSLATVLAMRPRALLLDEPTNDLDPGTRDRLIDVLNTLDLAYAVISHDLEFLSKTTTSWSFVRDGLVLPGGDAPLHVHIHAHDAGAAPHEHDEPHRHVHNGVPHTHAPHGTHTPPQPEHGHAHDHAPPHEQGGETGSSDRGKKRNGGS